MNSTHEVRFGLVGDGGHITGAKIYEPDNPDAWVQCNRHDFRNLGGMR